MTIEEIKRRGLITETATPQQLEDLLKFVTQPAVARDLKELIKSMKETSAELGEVLKETLETPKETLEETLETLETPLETPGETLETTLEAPLETPEEALEAPEETLETPEETLKETLETPEETLKVSEKFLEICKLNGWLEDGIVTLSALAKINNLSGVDFTSLDSFDEFVYFDGVAKLTGTFQNCMNLTSLTLPKSITYIGRDTFTGCKNLSKIICTNPTAPTITKTAFNNVGADVTEKVLLIPSESTGYTSGNWKTLVDNCGFVVETF